MTSSIIIDHVNSQVSSVFSLSFAYLVINKRHFFVFSRYQGWLGSRLIMLDKARPMLKMLPAPTGPLIWKGNSWSFVTMNDWMPFMLYRDYDLTQKYETNGLTNSRTNMSHA